MMRSFPYKLHLHLRMIGRILSAAFLVALLTGCVAVETPLEESTPPAATAVEPTAVAAGQLASPTIAPPEATETPTPEPTATPAPTQPASSCPRVHPALPPGFLAPGTIIFNVLQDDLQGPDIQKFSAELNPPQDVVLDLPGLTLLSYPDFAVSPDRKWLVLENYPDILPGQAVSSQQNLVLYNGDENHTRIFPWDYQSWGYFTTWLDAQRLLFYHSYEDFPPGTISVYDPFTGQREQFFPALPNLLERQQAGDWDPRYDPSFTRVLYLFYHWDVPLVIAKIAP